MTFVPIIFEDHLISSFRPLSWSMPTFEIRCGLFNTRERVELGLASSGIGLPSAGHYGGLLSRGILSGLQTSPHWAQGISDIKREFLQEDNRILFVNGRMAPRFDCIQQFIGLDSSVPDFSLFDDNGLLFSLVSSTSASKILESWESWEQAADNDGTWNTVGASTGKWSPDGLSPDSGQSEIGGEYFLSGGDNSVKNLLNTLLESSPSLSFEWIWDLVPATSKAIEVDVLAALESHSWNRFPFGIFPESGNGPASWQGDLLLSAGEVSNGIHVSDPSKFWTGPDILTGPGLAIDTSHGPVVIDRGVVIQPHVFLQGPLYVGPGSVIKAGARIYGESSFGIGNRLAGEIGESTFGDFTNKQHAGFIGHSTLGSWINLGAMTTCSDLKNNYGPIRVDLGAGSVDTNRQFVGLMMGDHAKTAIGVLFNTGTTVGFASNIFGQDMPPKMVRNFSWGGAENSPGYAVGKALETASTVMSRRSCHLGEPHRNLFVKLAGKS